MRIQRYDQIGECLQIVWGESIWLAPFLCFYKDCRCNIIEHSRCFNCISVIHMIVLKMMEK